MLERLRAVRRCHVAADLPARDEAVFGEDLRVDCYAGYRGEEAPRRFLIGARRIEVVDIVDRWLSPDHRYFKVLGDDGSVCILRHDVDTGCWRLVLFQLDTVDASAR